MRVEAQAKLARERLGRPPCLAIVEGGDAGARAYAGQIARSFARHGLAIAPSREVGGAQRQVAELLAGLSRDPTVDGVLVLAPLPGGLDPRYVIDELDPAKDVDGQHPVNLGRLGQRRRRFVPSTALGGIRILAHFAIEVEGRQAVVVGRSPVIGLPLALLLLDANASVTVVHSRTSQLASITTTADILCVAAGSAGLIGAEHVRPSAVVLDFGTNVDASGNLVGDVQAEPVAQVAGALTPVPGGTGPVTVAVLAEQLVRAAASC